MCSKLRVSAIYYLRKIFSGLFLVKCFKNMKSWCRIIPVRIITLNNVYFQALKEKDLGNEAYKKKDFATAHLHYDKAIEIDPKNIMYYTNKSAVLYEEGKFDECIELCEKAVNVGRENRATFAQIAK